MKKIDKSPLNEFNFGEHIRLKSHAIPIEQIKYEYKAYKPLIDEIEEKSSLEMIWYLIKNAGTILKIVYYVLKFRESIIMGKADFKTTLTSIIQALVLILGLIGVSVAPDLQAEIISVGAGIYAVVEAIKGYFTKDKEPNE